ncbi:MAG: flagellar motor switch protein FliG [Treponema sp.]|jgi:flagellar motor switch protein FliG|nr:flagellar motor switch protein FliG [Treponema sp.]
MPQADAPDPYFIKAPEGPGESKTARVAKFLILIGADEAAKILPRLEKEQIEAVSREIASIRGIGPEEGKAILEEFKSLLSSSYRLPGASSGGPEAARRILYAAFGAEKGEDLLNRALPPAGEGLPGLFSFLEDFKAEQISFLLREESPAVSALILSRLSPKLSAAVLSNAAPGDRTELARRIAKGAQVSPEVLGRIAEVLKEKALALGHSGHSLEIDGPKALAEILRHGDYSFGGKILQDLEAQDPALGRELRDELVTLDDVVSMGDRILQEKLRTMADRDIALLLKGRGRDLAEKLLSNVSAERRQRIREEGELLGPVPRRETEEAARSFLAWMWKVGPEALSTTKDVDYER